MIARVSAWHKTLMDLALLRALLRTTFCIVLRKKFFVFQFLNCTAFLHSKIYNGKPIKKLNIPHKRGKRKFALFFTIF